jgi:hypothetical protein
MSGHCNFCGEPTVYFFAGGLCAACTGKNARIKLEGMTPAPRPELAAFDDAMGVMHASARRTEMASEAMQRNKRASGASLKSYLAAAPIALTPEGQREALALGLVHYKTSDNGPKQGRLSIEIDPLLARAQRLRKSVITSARLHDQEAKKGSRRGAWYMLTLTYRDGSNSGPRDVSELLKRMRGYFNGIVARARRFAGEVFRYLWVGELTQRGRPHYHLLIWVPKGIYFGKVDHRGWWPHGSSQIEKARNAVGYLAKYASKFTSVIAAAFPKGFRTHGCGGLNTESRRELRWWKSPVSAREALGGEADIRKCQGGYFDKLTGEFWPSPWRVTFAFGRTIAWKVIPL